MLGQPDLARAKRVPFPSFWDVLGAVGNGLTDVGLVALENSIEGSVNVTLDPLIFSHELWIVRELQLSVAQSLVGVAGTRLDQVKKVVSMPVATAQCRTWLSQHLDGIEQEASPSTSEAVRRVAEKKDPQVVAIGTRHAAELYGLEVLETAIEDHDGNTTRFVLVARPEWGIPAPTGHDKTSIVCFQSSDHPGSLHMILGQFAARNLNLTKLESRPPKRPSASTASSSTSKGTWPMRSCPTASGTCTPPCRNSSSWARTRRPGKTGNGSARPPARPGERRTTGSRASVSTSPNDQGRPNRA